MGVCQLYSYRLIFALLIFVIFNYTQYVYSLAIFTRKPYDAVFIESPAFERHRPDYLNDEEISGGMAR